MSNRLHLLPLGLACAMLVSTTLVTGCATGASTPTEDRAHLVRALTVQADEWDKAIVRKDRAAIERNMADDFRHIDGQGNVETKAPFVDDLVSPDLQIDPYTVDDLDVRIFTDVALLSGTTRMTGKYQGKPFTSHYRYIDIYVRRNGQWKIVSVQISKIPNS